MKNKLNTPKILEQLISLLFEELPKNSKNIFSISQEYNKVYDKLPVKTLKQRRVVGITKILLIDIENILPNEGYISKVGDEANDTYILTDPKGLLAQELGGRNNYIKFRQRELAATKTEHWTKRYAIPIKMGELILAAVVGFLIGLKSCAAQQPTKKQSNKQESVLKGIYKNKQTFHVSFQ